MLNSKLNIKTYIVLFVVLSGLSGCSVLNSVGKSARDLTTFGNNDITKVDEKLIVPPSLQEPVPNTVKSQSVIRSSTAVVNKTAAKPVTAKPFTADQVKQATDKRADNIYIIVGTYPDQLDAIDTFTRVSSIGLKGATMESRRTKAGSLLHMVRLGPYTKQQDIDEAKDSLTNTGLLQFKIVKN